MTRALLALLLLAGCGRQDVELFGDCPGCDGGASGALRDRDPERCGEDAEHCEDDEYCVAGQCVCRPPLTVESDGDDCLDLNSHGDHCGAEGMSSCALCVDGACGASCPAGEIECERGCVDPETHPLHCGECGRPCGANQICLAGACVEFRPAPCASCPCDCARACCAYPGHPTDTICVDADTC